MTTTVYRWLGWEPAQNISKSPEMDPTKPTELGFVGFVGASQGDSQIFQATIGSPESLPDPFGPMPPDPADAASELALRERLREPRYAAIIARSPGDSSPRGLAIRAAACVWAASGHEGIARRRAAAWDGIPEALVAGREFSFQPPKGQPGPGCWVGTPRGNAEVLAWDLARAEALVRLLAQPQWLWVPVDRLTDPATRPGVRPKPKGGAR